MITEPLVPSYVRAMMKPNVSALEEHLDNLIEVCQSYDDASLEPYTDRFRDEVCDACDWQSESSCPCRLMALLPLAVSAIELRKRQETALANSLAWNDAEMPESD